MAIDPLPTDEILLDNNNYETFLSSPKCLLLGHLSPLMNTVIIQ